MGKGFDVPSRLSSTSFTLGARKRNVTRLSGWTSGETTGGDGVCANAATVKRNRVRGREKIAVVKSKDVRVMALRGLLVWSVYFARQVNLRFYKAQQPCWIVARF